MKGGNKGRVLKEMTGNGDHFGIGGDQTGSRETPRMSPAKGTTNIVEVVHQGLVQL